MSPAGEVLLVDDTLENLQVLGDLLRQHRFRVRVAASGDMALQSVQARAPDLILLDIRMPGMDGFETCRRLRQQPAAAAIPILFLSASTAAEDSIESFRAGGEDFIAKPFHAEEVLARVTTHLALARTRRELDQANDRLAEQVMAESFLRGTAEQVADEHTANLELTLAAAGLGAWETDAAGIALRLDHRARAVLGLAADQPLTWPELLARATVDGPTDLAERWIQAQRQQGHFAGECWWRPAGAAERRRIRLRGRPVVDRAGGTTRMVGVLWDVSAEHLLRERVTRAERMEALGLLAGGVAHDFNNQLAVMLGEVDILQLAEPDAAWKLQLDSIAGAIDASTGLIRDLLTFARQRDCQRSTIDLVAVVGTAARIAARSLGDGISCAIDLPAQPIWVAGNPDQLEGALLNLCIHARNAMGERGELRLRVELAAITDATCVATGSRFSGTYAVIRISDTGAALSTAERERLFAPFSHTAGQRNGMRMAAVLGCVASHDGHLTMETLGDHGTAFAIHLPPSGLRAILGTAAPAVARPAQAPGRLLLLDDQETVREVIADGLRRLGWEVAAFAEAEPALAAWRTAAPPFTVALVDLVMPTRSGAWVFRALRAADPQARVVLMSGHTAGEDLAALRAEGLAGFIEKPVKLRHLAQLLASLMEGARA